MKPAIFMMCVSSLAALAQNSYSVRPLIGSGSKGDGGPAAAALLDGPYGLAQDTSGNIYISETNAGVIRRVRPDGIIERFAGSGILADGLEGQPALQTDLLSPTALVIDANGNLIFADRMACRIRKVESDGTVHNVVGTGRCAGATSGSPGLGGGTTITDAPALETDVGSVTGLAVDSSGRLVYSDETTNLVRRMDSDGVVRTIAGNGTAGYTGDGSDAASASLRSPRGLAFDRDGNLYIADGENCRIRMVDTSGTISAVAQAGTCGSSPASITGLTYDSETNSLLMASPGVRQVIRVNLSTHAVAVVLGNGKVGVTDTSVALSYSLAEPVGVLAAGGRILVADDTAFHVLSVEGSTVTTFAGTWPQLASYPSPLTARLLRPTGLCFTPDGSLTVLDAGAERILSWSSSDQLTALAGARYPSGFTGGLDGPAISAQIGSPHRVACGANGNVYFTQGNHIRLIDSQGVLKAYLDYVRISTTSSSGTTTTTTSSIDTPDGMVIDSNGRLLFSEASANRVIRYDPSTQTTTVVAGNGLEGFKGDGGAAADARLSSPGDLAFDSKGGLLIADRGNGRIRRVDSDGTIQTIAGSARGFSYDDISGQLATSIGLGSIAGLAVDAEDNIYISEISRISRISVDGRIQVLAGFVSEDDQGTKTYRVQPLNGCDGIAIDTNGRVYLSVRQEGRVVRLLAPGDPGPPPVIFTEGVVSSTGFGGASAAAPGSWIEIYGTNLAASTRPWTNADFQGAQAPTSLDGTSVSIAGQAAFLSYISPSQVNAQVPSTVSAGTQQLTVTTAAGITSSYSLTVETTEPGVFALAASGKQYAGGVLSDGVTFVLPANSISGLVSRPARAGESVTFYGIGFGPVTPRTDAGTIVSQINALDAALSVRFSDAAATVTYAGLAPGFIGLYQFNVTVPSGVSGDAVPLTFALAGKTLSQTLYTAVAP